ncbi:MAG: tetraacyldisaccharide 4'-kinase [Betaproteobacteria bacterium]|nr:tetraacyldisaccharide 4'-kinase [Betaproteobacteria bacterium]
MSPDFIARHWYRLTPVSVLAYPLSLVFRFAVWLRRLLYGAGLIASTRLPVPVIVVGNLTVGGTGKTPLVIWMVRMLAEAGRTPGVLARGYGGLASAPREVRAEDDALLAGDEPVLLAARCSCPVWAGADRARTGAALLAAHPDCDVLVCDDGLQHYALARDIEIAVEDARGIGNGLMLPAGPLREPADRPVDAFVINGEPADRPVDAFVINGEPAEARSTSGGCARAGAYAMRLEPGGIYLLHDPARTIEASEVAAKRLHAVAGIGEPRRFFAQLVRLGLAPQCHPFPDHHRYTEADLNFPNCDLVLMTEKDAVKCTRLGRTDLAALRVEAKLVPAFGEFILEKLSGLPAA